MTVHFTPLAGAMLLCAAVGLGQTSQPTSPRPSMPGDSLPSKRVTATGCLQRSGGSATGGSSTADAGAGQSGTRKSGYVLKNARITAEGSGTTVRVTGSDSDLQQHVNKQVEIQGQLLLGIPDASATATSGSSGTTGQTGSTPRTEEPLPDGAANRTASGGTMPTLQAQSVRVVSSSCAETR